MKKTAHFGLLFPPGTSHVTATTTIARELIRRGHRATAFNFLDVEELVTKEKVEFHPLGVKVRPKGSVIRDFEDLGKLGGLKFLQLAMKYAQLEIVTLLEEAPAAMRAAEVTALLVDQGQPAGSTIAEKLGVPFVTICNSLQFDPDPCVPLPISGRQPTGTWFDQLRNQTGWQLYDWAFSPLRYKINAYRKSWGLKSLHSLYQTFSPLLELAQETADFDFPRINRPSQFEYIGVIHRSYTADIPFPFECLDGRPLIYASLGTVYDNQVIFRKIAESCAKLNVQLVITLGDKGDIGRYCNLPGSPIIVNYAPQPAVLERTAVTICHCGHNTVLDSLDHGVPVIAIPVQSADTGIAARLRFVGAGDWIELHRFTSQRLTPMLERVITDPSYKKQAQAMAASFKAAGGEHRAADLIEEKLKLSL